MLSKLSSNQFFAPRNDEESSRVNWRNRDKSLASRDLSLLYTFIYFIFNHKKELKISKVAR